MDRSDVFLSYRRKDVEFTKQLDAALKATGREVWVDWEDIPPGVEGFADEIQRGIEGADAFIAVLSPAYIESEYCLMELREAIKLKKRVIPIVLHKFDHMPIPEGIGHINWVYFTPHAGQENTFEQSFPKVISALEVDLDHARDHTRLLLRAKDWDKSERNHSYLLRRDEIDKAETWLTKGTNLTPTPTSLHTDYIFASRAQERAQQRRTRALLASGLGVSLVLLVVSIIMGIVAENNRQQAEYRRQISEAESLASQAVLELGQLAPERAAPLALTAYKDYPYVPEVEAALATISTRQNLRAVLNGAVSVTGNKVLLFQPPQLQAYNLEAKETLWTLPITSDTQVITGKTQVAIFNTISGGIQLVNLETGASMYEDPELPVSQYPTFSQDESYLLISTADKVIVLDTQSGEKTLELELTAASGGFINYTIYGHLFTYSDSADLVGAYNLTTGEKVELETSIFSGTASPDGTYTALSTSAGFMVIETATFEKVYEGTGQPEWLSDKALSIYSYESKTLQVIDVTTGEAVDKIPSEQVIGVYTNHDQATFAVLYQDKVMVFDSATLSEQASIPLPAFGEGAYLTWSAARLLLNYTDQDQNAQLAIIDPESETLIALGMRSRYYLTAVPSPEGDMVALYSGGDLSQVAVFSMSDGTLLYTLPPHTEYYSLKWADDYILTYSNDRSVRVYTAADGRLVMNASGSAPIQDVIWVGNSAFVTLEGSSYGLPDTILRQYQLGDIISLRAGEKPSSVDTQWMALQVGKAAPDGRLLMVTTEGAAVITSPDGSLVRLVAMTPDEVPGMPPEMYTPSVDPVIIADWSPDYTQVVTGHYGLTMGGGGGGDMRMMELVATYAALRVWDAQTGELLQTWGGTDLDTTINTLDWSGDTILSSKMYGDIQLRDASTGEVLNAIPGEMLIVHKVAFSPDGKQFAVARSDNKVFIYDTGSVELLMTLETGGQVHDVAWSPDGQRLVTAAWGTPIAVWDMKTGTKLVDYDGHSDWVNALVWSPEGKRIVSGGWDKNLHLWDATTGSDFAILEGHTAAVTSLQWTPDAIISVSADKTLRRWLPWLSIDELATQVQECCLLRESTDGI